MHLHVAWIAAIYHCFLVHHHSEIRLVETTLKHQRNVQNRLEVLSRYYRWRFLEVSVRCCRWRILETLIRCYRRRRFSTQSDIKKQNTNTLAQRQRPKTIFNFMQIIITLIVKIRCNILKFILI